MLKDYLEERNISLYSISNATGISYSTLNYISTGKTDILNTSLKNAMKIAEALDITVEELCNYAQKETICIKN